ERDAPVAVGVGRGEERLCDGLRRLRRTLRDVALREAHRDHAIELFARERSVAVVVVDAECERELFLIRAGDELAYALEELLAHDDAVTIQIERGEHAAREVLAPEAERALQLLHVEHAVAARHARERPLEGRDEPRVDGRWPS